MLSRALFLLFVLSFPFVAQGQAPRQNPDAPETGSSSSSTPAPFESRLIFAPKNSFTQYTRSVASGTDTITEYCSGTDRLSSASPTGYQVCVAYTPGPPPGGQWYPAIGQSCAQFCTGLGLQNTQSPDVYSINNAGVMMPMTGSWCTSGEVISPSASAAAAAGVFVYVNGTWPNPDTGAGIYEGRSFGPRCYGLTGWDGSGSVQLQDNDPTDLTMGCYCSP